MAAADAGAGPLQDDGRGKDRSAAELVALLLPLRSHQTALTKAVGLGDVAREPGRLIIQPKTVRNFNKRLKESNPLSADAADPITAGMSVLTCRPRGRC